MLVSNEGQFYNPAMAGWTSTGALPNAAGPPSVATFLDTGNVLASGTRCTYSGCGHAPTNGCFLYTSSSNTWSQAGGMNQARISHTSTLLPSGKVLVAGGYTSNHFTPLNSAELYTP